MVLRANYLFKLGMLALIVWCGWGVYGYFFEVDAPQIFLSGLDEFGYYCSDTHCTLTGNERQKISYVSVWLDDKQLSNNYKVGRRKFAHDITIDTTQVSDGKHVLKVEATGSTYKKQKVAIVREFYVDNIALQAAFIRPESEQKVLQGRTLHVQFQVNKPVQQAVVKVGSNIYSAVLESPNSRIMEAFVPVLCEDKPGDVGYVVEIVDRVGNQIILDGHYQVLAAQFKTQSLKVDSKKIEFEREVSRSQSDLNQELDLLAQKSPKEKLWKGKFYLPLESTGVATEFGVQRVTAEKGRYDHKALDLLAMPRSVVWAPQDGVVIIKDRYADSGNTVVIDHGLGIFTLLFHLEDFANINIGDKIRRGNPVGRMGKTGYASGYHLHWEMRINGIQVDPEQWTRDNF